MRQLLSAALLLLACQALADERILEFRSDIELLPDGWIEVTETIRVRAEGQRIRRGIYRDFPTRYFDKLGNRYVVDFQPLSVLRDAVPEDFHQQSYLNGTRVYFGSEHRFLDPGVYTYSFRYRASRMLGFFDDHDELYWNVTGFDWAFPIDAVTASVDFGFDVPIDQVSFEAYTGGYGAKGRDYTAGIDARGRVTFAGSKPLPVVHGMTIVVGWPKGYVEAPGDWQRFKWLLRDNRNLLAALLGLLGVLGYYIPVWRRFGKDPEVGPVITRYQPPEGFSPASLRYIRQTVYDDKTMTAGILSLAVKGYLRIDHEEGKSGFLGIGAEPSTHTLVKLPLRKNPPPLATGEKALYEALFSDGDSVALVNENHERLGRAKRAHSHSLKQDYSRRYFRRNGALNIVPVLILIGTAALALMFGPSVPVVACIVVTAVTVAVFASVMKRPTLLGRQVLDEIAGFQDYLEIAEKDELNLRNPPDKTPELFEAYLPFALALGVSQQWAERFTVVIAMARDIDGNGYRPGWYNGNWSNVNVASTTQALSSGLSSSISSSVTPPGSTSGGGGGGFSGGGGGGGGGGGW